ncbi:helicase-related protein [Lacticaseibacillus baoqingensis]|uniref:Helicase-related protein n=1 Tax=Lacticaseibacillus baoqingensis TaxID=2486013 RepID=A0ABW4E3L1_9LACO|nr:helicase-related protein [Lacticaseibacillus baoqingensis]
MWYSGMQLLDSEVDFDTSVAQAVPGLAAGRCQRCGQKGLVELPSGDDYCPHCINLGRVSSQTTLYRFAAPPLPPVEQPLTWQGELTPAQARIAAELVAAVQTKTEHLLWAVTGAGKTEILFPAIASVLTAGGRVGVATPRLDVVRELAPRLQAAFAHTAMAVRYGGVSWPQTTVALTVMTTHQLLRYYQAFDLLVIDENDAFPFVHDPALWHAVSAASRGAKLWLSATPPKRLQQAAKHGKIGLSILPRRFHGQPLPVPQVQIRKGQLPHKIPSKWVKALQQIMTTRQCLLFVPDIAWLAPIVQQLKVAVTPAVSSVHAADPNRVEKVSAFRQGQLRLLVTTTILERGVTIPRCAVVVLGADSQRFDAAALIQMAGRAGRAADSPDDPVWFYARHDTLALHQAVHTIRQLNARKSQ